MNLSNEDVQDILRLLDTLPFGEAELETSRFVLRLRRVEDGLWAQDLRVRPAADGAEATAGASPGGTATPPAIPPGAGHATPPPLPGVAGPASLPAPAALPVPAARSAHGAAPAPPAADSAAGAPAAGAAGPPLDGATGSEAAVRAPLMGTFYRAPQPGAAPFVEAGAQVGPETVVAIIETMKLMNPVYAGTSGTVAAIAVNDGQFVERDAVLMLVRAPDAGRTKAG